RVAYAFLVYMPPPIPRCSNWAYSSLNSPSCFSLPRYGSRIGLHIFLFEACSTFTRVAACTLALSPIRDTLIEGFSHFVTSMTASLIGRLGSPSVPMMVRHRSPESLASHGRRTTITWSCKTKKLKRTVPPGLVRREAGGRPQCRPRRRRRPNCRIGRGVGLLQCRRSCVFWQRLT